MQVAGSVDLHADVADAFALFTQAADAPLTYYAQENSSPGAQAIDTGRWGLEAERRIVQPRIVLALGASAARGLLGRTVSITRERGRAIMLDDRSELWVTAHPSYLLRLDGEAREQQAALFAADLAAVHERLDELEG